MSRVGQGIIEGLQELVDYSEGKLDLRTSRLNVSPVCKSISVEEIKETREKLGMSQGVFAIVLGVSAKTVQSWETGRYRPDGAARRLITMLQADPELPVKYGIVSK
ncbi:MAG: helix-turn-helix domain-containing protein [Sporomusaceae bacterium]|jgi:putative transcriptional regulator|nr:helix-turn-helix domain-containing protein [Sporomusaceae bacterium]